MSLLTEHLADNAPCFCFPPALSLETESLAAHCSQQLENYNNQNPATFPQAPLSPQPPLSPDPQETANNKNATPPSHPSTRTTELSPLP